MQKLHEELVTLLKRDGFVTANDAERMARWDPFDQNRYADFFDVEWMFGMPRAQDNSEAVFDIVIANPPYVRHEDIKDLTPVLKSEYHYECAASRADLYVFFYERSVKLLKPQGVLSFITSNKWYRAKYGENLRLFMASHMRLNSIIDFGDEAVFTALAYPTIVIATRREQPLNPAPASDQVRALNWSQEHPVEQFPVVFQQEAFDVPQSELKKQGWQLEPQSQRQLLARIRSAGTPLGEYVQGRFYYGIKTGLNEAFVIDGATRQRLIAEDPKSAELIKPYLRGRDVKRWKVEWADLYLIAFPFGFHEQLSEYPAILKHLSQFEDALRKRGQCTSSRGGKSEGQHHWLELDNNPKESYLAEFEKPKILVPAIEDGVEYAPDLEGFYGNDKTSIIVTEEWRYVLGVLNSSLSWWITRQTFSGKQGGFYEFKPMYVSNFPIPSGTSTQKALMSSVVDAVLGTRDQRYEQLINGLVFELFFPEELHASNIRLFEACEAASLAKLAELQGDAQRNAAEKMAATLFANDHLVYAMLFDMQALEVVRIIEGNE